MRATKIVVIGAGSASFGLGIVKDLTFYADSLGDATVVLNDVDAGNLDLMTAVARRLNEASSTPLRIESTTDQRAALDGADFVIVSVEVERFPCWRKDWEIPLRNGVKHVLGENGGPGGLSHTLRVVDLMLSVAKNVEEMAPGAWLLNFTNPMSRVCLALERATSLRCIGLCHQISAGYLIVAKVLGLIDRSTSWEDGIDTAHSALDIKAAGLNHFTFMYDIRDRATGADLYPLFCERVRSMPSDFEPLSRRLLDAFGMYPANGDGHIGEYVSVAWETSSLKGFDFGAAERHRDELPMTLRSALASANGLNPLVGKTSGERAVPIISAILSNKNQFELALNIPNHGCISGLPDWAIVEVPGVVYGGGVSGLSVPALPQGITSLLALQVAVQDRAVYAAMYGDRQAALQALLLDPVVWSYDAAQKILDELLKEHARYLPRFAAS